jgi:PadR family transcriptional regulator PadR
MLPPFRPSIPPHAQPRCPLVHVGAVCEVNDSGLSQKEKALHAVHIAKPVAQGGVRVPGPGSSRTALRLFPAFLPTLILFAAPKNRLTIYTVRHTVCIAQWVLHSMTIEPNLFENLRMELRRGSLIMAVLAQLRTEQYGYTLRKALAEHGMAIDEGTLYPLLRRLESQGLLVSEWREEDKRNKRFYVLSADGKAMLKQLLAEWKSIDSSLNGIVKG